MKNCVVALSLFAVLLASAVVRADEPAFGDPGHVALSVERLFGYSHNSDTATVGGTDTTASSDAVSFLGNPGAGSYSTPRVGADVFVAPNFSLGLAAMVLHLSADSASGTLFQLAPRVGYALHASPGVALWPRVGLTYEHSSSSSNSSATASDQTFSLTSLTVDLPIAIRMVSRAYFVVDPIAEIGVSGSRSVTVGSLNGGSVDHKANEFGLQFGFLVYL